VVHLDQLPGFKATAAAARAGSSPAEFAWLEAFCGAARHFPADKMVVFSVPARAQPSP
jgi:hypothetical protein